MQKQNENTMPINENKSNQPNDNGKKKGGFLGKFVIALLIILLCCAVLMGIWRVSRGKMSYDDWDEVLSYVDHSSYNDGDFILWQGDGEAYFLEEDWDDSKQVTLTDEYQAKLDELEALNDAGDLTPNDYQEKIDEINDWYEIESADIEEEKIMQNYDFNTAQGVFDQKQIVDSITSSADSIDRIKINAVNSKVVFENSDDNQVTITIEAQNNGKGRIRYALEQENNSISFTEKKSRGQFIVRVAVPKKTFDRIDLNNVAANINVDQLNCKKLTVNSVSGNIDVTGAAQILTMNTVSGNLTADIAPAKTIDINSVSGNISIKQYAAMPETSISTVSGNVELLYGANASFTVDAKTVKPFEALLENGTNVVGTGDGKVKINSTSGAIKLVLDDTIRDQRTEDKSVTDSSVATASQKS